MSGAGPVLTLSQFDPDWNALVDMQQFDRVRGDDERVTAQTIAVMSNEVRAAVNHARVRQAVKQCITEANLSTQPTFEQVTDAVFWYAKNHVTYTHEEELEKPFNLAWDVELEEVMTPPADLIAMPNPRGDCNDFSMLVAAMLRIVGIGCAFKTIAADKTQPNAYSHVYVLACNPADPKHLRPLDASNGPEPGVEYAQPLKARVWPIEPMIIPASEALRGLADGDDGGFDWDTFANTLTNDVTKIAAPILQSRYSTPTVAPGTYYTTRNANGTVTTAYGQPVGSTTTLLPTSAAVTGATGMNSLLIYACIGVCVVMLLKK